MVRLMIQIFSRDRFDYERAVPINDYVIQIYNQVGAIVEEFTDVTIAKEDNTERAAYVLMGSPHETDYRVR